MSDTGCNLTVLSQRFKQLQAELAKVEAELKEARKHVLLEAADEIEEICLVLSCTRNAHGLPEYFRRKAEEG